MTVQRKRDLKKISNQILGILSLLDSINDELWDEIGRKKRNGNDIRISIVDHTIANLNCAQFNIDLLLISKKIVDPGFATYYEIPGEV